MKIHLVPGSLAEGVFSRGSKWWKRKGIPRAGGHGSKKARRVRKQGGAPDDEGNVRKILHAFRVHLHRDRGLSEWSSVRYVTVAGALLSFCEERGHALDQGRVPASILIDFAASCDDARAVRGAVLFCEFLRAWGVALPELDPAPGTLNEAQVEAFLEMAASQPEPYATLLCLLPWSGLRAQDLLRLPRDAVREGSDGSVSLVHEGALVGLGARAQERLRGYLAATSAEEGLLFPGQSGEAIGGATITRRLKQCRVAAGLPEFRVTALSDAYQVHYFEPAPAWPAGGGLDGLGEFVDESPGSAPEVLDDPSAIDPSAAEPSVDEEVSLDPPSIPPDDPNEAPSMTYDDEPYDDDEPDDLEPYEDDRYEPGSSEPGEPREPLRSRGRRRGRRRSAARSSRPRPSGAQNARVRDVDGLLPRSGHIEIRFRDPERGGRPRYCGRYLVRDVAPDGSIEAFIYEHLAPNLGGGEYLIFTSASDLQPRAVVDIAPPPPHARPSALGGQEPERQAGESSFEAGFRAGRRDAMREPYPAPPFGYDAGPALGLPLPAPEPAGPPSWFVEERRLQYEREKDERKAQLEREEREERRREREWQERREREEREFQRRQAELERQRVELERREERMEQRRKEEIAAAAAAAHPLKRSARRSST